MHAHMHSFWTHEQQEDSSSSSLFGSEFGHLRIIYETIYFPEAFPTSIW